MGVVQFLKYVKKTFVLLVLLIHVCLNFYEVQQTFVKIFEFPMTSNSTLIILVNIRQNHMVNTYFR